MDLSYAWAKDCCVLECFSRSNCSVSNLWSFYQVMLEENNSNAMGGIIIAPHGLSVTSSCFHPFDWRSLKINDTTGTVKEFKLQAISNETKLQQLPVYLRVSLFVFTKSQCQKKKRDSVTSWYIKHPGFFVVIGGVGARPWKIEQQKLIFLHLGSIKFWSRYYLFAVECIAHGVVCLNPAGIGSRK